MKKYFVMSDIHSFYGPFILELDKAGFEKYNPNHILIICGDLFDRGPQSVELLHYLLSLPEDRLILIRGNHEDLMEECLEQLEERQTVGYHHFTNGTVKTISQFALVNEYDLASGFYNFREIKRLMSGYFKLIERCVDYYELGDYIFVHGWVPTDFKCEPILVSDKGAWKSARWDNGMKMANLGATIPNKTIVCGHYHTGWGHKNIKNTCLDEFDNFEIYRNEGIIALDSCVAYSGKLNVLVIEEE